jgi:ABC-2 type transport system permease protein
MRRSLFLKTLRDGRGAILVWGLGMAAVAAFYVSFFPSVGNDPQYKELWSSLPPALRAMFGNVVDISTFDGFLRSELLSYFPILIGIMFILRSAASIAGEEEARTADILLAQPLPRWRVLVEKFAGVSVVILAATLLAGLGLAAGVLSSRIDASVPRLFGAVLVAYVPAFVCGALALVGTALFHRARHASLIAVTYIIAAYVLNALSIVVPKLEPYRFLSVFHYYQDTNVLAGSIAWGSILGPMMFALIAVACAVLLLQRKEIAS